MSSHIESCHVLSCQIWLGNVESCRVILSHVWYCQIMLSHVQSYLVMSKSSKIQSLQGQIVLRLVKTCSFNF